MNITNYGWSTRQEVDTQGALLRLLESLEPPGEAAKDAADEKDQA